MMQGDSGLVPGTPAVDPGPFAGWVAHGQSTEGVCERASLWASEAADAA